MDPFAFGVERDLRARQVSQIWPPNSGFLAKSSPERNSQTDWRRRQSRANYSPLRTRKNTGKTPLSRQFREPSSPGTVHPSRSYNQDMDGGISSEQGITGLASAASRFSVFGSGLNSRLKSSSWSRLKAIMAGIRSSSDCATTKAREALSKSILVKLDPKALLGCYASKIGGAS